MLEFFFIFGDLTCGMCYRLGSDLKSFTGTAFRQQIFYRNGVPDRSGLLSPLLNHPPQYLKMVDFAKSSPPTLNIDLHPCSKQ